MENTKNKTRFLEPALIAFVFAVLAILLGAPSAFGSSSGSQSGLNVLPAGVIYPTPVGILYPGFNIAAGVNAATLVTGKRTTAAQVSAAPALQSGDPLTTLASISTSSNNIGWSIGYSGATGGSSGSTNGIFAGVGFSMSRVSLGVGLRDTDFSVGGFDPSVDVGSKVELGKDFSMGAVAYGIEGTMGVSAGFGFGRKKKENVEVNFLLPSLGGTDYATTFAATIYSGRFGTTFRTTYFLTSKSFSHTLGTMIWVTGNFNLLLQLTSPRTLSAGLTYVF